MTMIALRKPESRLLVFVLALLTAGAAVALRSGTRSPPPRRNNVSTDGRRTFLTKTLASASISLIQPNSAQAVSFPGRSFFGQSNEDDRPPQDRPEILYTEFKDMLENRELDSVEFGFDGRSIVALDRRGMSHKVDDLPDDPKLLQILYDRDVSVSVKAFNFPKQTNTVNWCEYLRLCVSASSYTLTRIIENLKSEIWWGMISRRKSCTSTEDT